MSAPVIKTILFDLDGTLIDTEPSAARAIREFFAQHGVPIDESDAHVITGRTWDAAFGYLFAKYPLRVPEAQAREDMIQAYREMLQKELHIIPGAPEAVRALAPHFTLGLVSGSPRREILWALDRLGVKDLFRVILGAEDYPRSKPEPDGYLAAMRQLGATAETTLVFEDSAPGIASARTAGAWVAAITCANHLGQDQSTAHVEIADLTEINAVWIAQVKFRSR